MNRKLTNEHGSVLVIALMTITIMTMICATSLYISSQNSSGGMQTAGWQQALTAAEAGIDVGIRALNASTSASPSPWKGWKNVTFSSPASNYTLPTIEPTAQSTPNAPSGNPDSTHYYYYPSSSLTLSAPNSEGAVSSSAWVTVDSVGGTNKNLYSTTTSQQWWRIRSTGQTTYPTGSALLKRVSNNRLDNDLRNSIVMNFNRDLASTKGPNRTIEVIVSPQAVANSIWGQGLFLQNSLSMSGGGSIGHYNSSSVATSTFVTAPTVYRSTDYTETLVGMLNANGSDLRSTYIYGGMTYSTTSAAPKNTGNVQGSITTPFTTQVPTVSNPSWTPNVTYGGGSPPFVSIGPGSSNSSASNPYKVKVNGSLTVPGGQTMALTSPNSGGSTTYIEIWVTGDFTTSGSGVINQANGVHVTYYVDGKITVSGQSMNNQSGLAQNQQFIVVGGGDVTVSGSGNFIGTIEAPGSKVTVSGSGLFIGGLIANTMDISGGASFYYDDKLANYTSGGNSSSSTGAYAFASWFEDDSDPSRNALDTSYVVHPIIY
jgi:hypothetical protein